MPTVPNLYQTRTKMQNMSNEPTASLYASADGTTIVVSTGAWNPTSLQPFQWVD